MVAAFGTMALSFDGFPQGETPMLSRKPHDHGYCTLRKRCGLVEEHSQTVEYLTPRNMFESLDDYELVKWLCLVLAFLLSALGSSPFFRRAFRLFLPIISRSSSSLKPPKSSSSSSSPADRTTPSLV